MIPAVLLNAALIGLSAQSPVPVSEAKRGPVMISGLENATITFPASCIIKFEPVKTPQGNRIRLTSGGVVLEATKMKIRIGNTILSHEVGTDGTMNVTSERAPNIVPMPMELPPSVVPKQKP